MWRWNGVDSATYVPQTGSLCSSEPRGIGPDLGSRIRVPNGVVEIPLIKLLSTTRANTTTSTTNRNSIMARNIDTANVDCYCFFFAGFVDIFVCTVWPIACNIAVASCACEPFGCNSKYF